MSLHSRIKKLLIKVNIWLLKYKVKPVYEDEIAKYKID